MTASANKRDVPAAVAFACVDVMLKTELGFDLVIEDKFPVFLSGLVPDGSEFFLRAGSTKRGVRVDISSVGSTFGVVSCRQR